MSPENAQDIQKRMLSALEKIARVNHCTSIRMNFDVMDDKVMMAAGFIKDVKLGYWRSKHHLVKKDKSKSRSPHKLSSTINSKQN